TRHGIDIRTGAQAESVTEQGIRLRDGALIEAGTVVCTIGTTANALIASLDLPLVNKRLKAGPELGVEGQDAVGALGDCAAVSNAYDDKWTPPTAQHAVRQARRLADNIARVINGQPTRPFSYKPLGMLASIGNRKAVGLVFG